ncbi:hypothetical protein ACFVYP_29390 [Kitasatospora sp. NPDC058201]|uniref:hypothetical protein n=1 Tax=Streptomycetaceae TaxID=2062 RepID=UPI002E76C47B|nr:hypothetical protein [Streptomyces sp. BE303]MED7947483.1 hypothetical protein [Streptomyces sp. BE303]
MTIRTKVAAGVMSIAALGLGAVSASPAAASSGYCASYDACLYYSPNFQGAFFGDGSGTSQGYETYQDDSAYTFGGGGAGNGQYVRNNAASVINNNTTYSLTITTARAATASASTSSAAPAET